MKPSSPNPQRDKIISLTSKIAELEREISTLKQQAETRERDLAQANLKVKSLGAVVRLADGKWVVTDEMQAKLNELFPHGFKN